MTKTIELVGRVDEDHQLIVEVPNDVPAGPVKVAIIVQSNGSATENEDDAGAQWAAGLGREWEEDLADPTQDIYTLSDGEPVNEAR